MKPQRILSHWIDAPAEVLEPHVEYESSNRAPRGTADITQHISKFHGRYSMSQLHYNGKWAWYGWWSFNFNSLVVDGLLIGTAWKVTATSEEYLGYLDLNSRSRDFIPLVMEHSPSSSARIRSICDDFEPLKQHIGKVVISWKSQQPWYLFDPVTRTVAVQPPSKEIHDYAKASCSYS